MLQFRAERVGILRRTVRGSDTLRSCTPDQRRPACCDGPTERDPRDANVRDHEPLASHFPRKLSAFAWFVYSRVVCVLLGWSVGRLSRVECGELCRPQPGVDAPNLNSMSVAPRQAEEQGGPAAAAAAAMDGSGGSSGGVRGWLRQFVPLR